MSVIDLIEKPNDIKKLSREQIRELCGEIREFLVSNISRTGGHLASNLGAVELTIALHLFLDFPEDKLIWDVGHQAYTHKILTGRKDGFKNLRKSGGMSGFPKRSESECDSFDTGHASTSISAGLGYVKARDIMGLDYKVVSVIGDGSLTGGLAFEGIDAAADLKTNYIIVLNDNNMSISKNVGGLARHLTLLRTNRAYQDLKSEVKSALGTNEYGREVAGRISAAKNSIKQLLIPGMLFENIGVTYLGPVDGHNVFAMLAMLRQAAKIQGAVVLHVQTKKGKGYEPAERNPELFHGVGKFDIKTGKPCETKTGPTYSDVFSHVICKEAGRDDKLVAITAAMGEGTGLKRFAKKYPDRFFDVGIAEGHAVTFAAGLACAGMKPVFAVYSSFLQRAYDEIMMDVCLQNLHVVFAIDRAGLVGADGETHQGAFDLSYLSSMPNMTVMAPKNRWELAAMLRFALREMNSPVAIRYPKGESCAEFKEMHKSISYGKSEVMTEGCDVAIFAVGSMVSDCMQAACILKDKGISCSVINARFIKPVDSELVQAMAKTHRMIVTVEENVLLGGYGSAVGDCLCGRESVTFLKIGIEDRFVEHGSIDCLKETLGMRALDIARRIEEGLNGKSTT